MIDAVIGLTRVSACEIEEKPTETKKLSLEERKALAESILEYCMEAGKERDAKVKKIIEELSEYLERKRIRMGSYMHAQTLIYGIIANINDNIYSLCYL